MFLVCALHVVIVCGVFVVAVIKAQRWHIGNEPFGRQWQSGDVVGCMIDLTEMNIMFTLNGEMLISDSGSEMAFKDIEIGEGEFFRVFRTNKNPCSDRAELKQRTVAR